MMSMGPAAPSRLAMMATIVISCSSLFWCGTSSCSNFAAQAFIPPVGPISGRIVFSSDAFLVMRSSSDETGERTTANHPPPLAFLDDRYADLFRVKKEPTSVWGAILGRLHNRHKPAAKSADIKHKHDQANPSHSSSRSRSPPILKLDPETGRYVVQKPTALPSASASASSSHDVSNATLAQVGTDPKDGASISSESLATAATSAELNNATQENVITYSFNPEEDYTAVDAITSTADNSSTASSVSPSASHHEGASLESSPSQTPTSIALRSNATDGHLGKRQESKGESQEHQITSDLLDVVGKAFAGESLTDDDSHIGTATVDMASLARSDDKNSNNACPSDDTTKVDISHQQLGIAARDLVHPDNEDDTSNLPNAPSVVDNDDKSPEDTKIPIATLAPTADFDNSRENLPIDCAITKDSAASPTHEEDIPQLAVTSPLEEQHPTTLSEQGVRVVKSAAEAATKIAFFVGKAALTLAVAVAKAALALDEERNIADRAPRIDVDELDRDATDALKMAENALSRSSNQVSNNALFASQQSSGREAKRARDFFFGLFGWLNIAKLAEMASPSGQASAHISTSTTVITPHPPSPPSTLEALQSLEASLSKEIFASVDDAPSRDQLHRDEQKEEETKPIMEIEISEKARKRQITSIEISSAIKKARDAAAKASREAEELETMLLGLGK